jgi:ubiquinone biosynthesis protein UbiJ
VGDKLASLVEGAIGPSFDRLVERGEALERNTLSSLTKPAQESLDAATDAGRQATRMASSTATTVADETRKQVVIAGNSVLEALSKQVEALRGSVDELRKTLPNPPANGDDSAA